eukprot:3167090-Rhodomonas_salina.1
MAVYRTPHSTIGGGLYHACLFVDPHDFVVACQHHTVYQYRTPHSTLRYLGIPDTAYHYTLWQYTDTA